MIRDGFLISHVFGYKNVPLHLKELILFRHSEKSFLVEKYTFLPFWSNLKDFIKIPKIRNLKLIVSQLFGVSQFTTRIILARKIAFFGVFCTQLFWGSKKHQKRDFTSKCYLCDDCDTPKSWVAIRLRVLIFWILKKSWKFPE